MNAGFQIEVDGKLREVDVAFGNERDVQALTRWRFPTELARNEPIADALEYGRLAAKRWRYYRRADATVSSAAELHARLRRDRKAELAMMFVVRPRWRSSTSILGFAYFRRTWCHHLVVD